MQAVRRVDLGVDQQAPVQAVRCDLHCPPEGVSLAVPLALAGAFLAVCLTVMVVADYLAVIITVVFLLTAAGVGLGVGMRRLAWLSVVHWPAMQRYGASPGEPTAVTVRALPAAPLAIEAPRPAVAAVVLDVHDGERLDV